MTSIGLKRKTSFRNVLLYPISLFLTALTEEETRLCVVSLNRKRILRSSINLVMLCTGLFGYRIDFFKRCFRTLPCCLSLSLLTSSIIYCYVTHDLLSPREKKERKKKTTDTPRVFRLCSLVSVYINPDKRLTVYFQNDCRLERGRYAKNDWARDLRFSTRNWKQTKPLVD